MESYRCSVVFSNNPFNYTHFEENYVSNPKAHIFYDYGAKIPPDTLRDNFADSQLQIATYSLQEGKGKVIIWEYILIVFLAIMRF